MRTEHDWNCQDPEKRKVWAAATSEALRVLEGKWKTVIICQLFAAHDGLLWYMCPYEGFEANENVIYVGGCPNQHLLPLFEHLIPRYGARPYLVGANYVWGWEMNRLARELISNAGGEVLGERYLPLEETAVERIVAEIAQRRPSFILNNLIGPSSYAFLEAIKALGDRDPAFHAENCPVVSCDLMECELDDIAAGAAAGQLCAASYFDSIATPENAAFKARVTERHGTERRVSSVFASAYTAVRLCVDAIVAAGGDDPDAVRRELYNRSWPTLFGALAIDRETNHDCEAHPRYRQPMLPSSSVLPADRLGSCIGRAGCSRGRANQAAMYWCFRCRGGSRQCPGSGELDR